MRDEVRGNESTERDGKEVRVRVRVRERLRVGGNERDCECCFEIFLNAIYRTRGGLKRNRVQWTQFQCIKTESTQFICTKTKFTELEFLCTKTESNELNF